MFCLLKKTSTTSFVILLFLLPATASALPLINQIVAFGDSLTDTGNLFIASGGGDPANGFPPLNQGYDNGRFSNGPVWVEELANRLGVPTPLPSLAGGTNHAWGGAQTGDGISAQGTPNLGRQIQTYLGTGNIPMEDELLVVWGGSNDFNNAAPGSIPNPAELVANILAHITTLAAAAPGTNLNFFVPNLPPLGDTVRGQNLPPEQSGGLNLLSAVFNQLLNAQLGPLSEALGVTIFEFDVFSLVKEISAMPNEFGFTNITDTARLPSPINVSQQGTGIVDNPDEYAYFDDVHPTRAFHKILGAEAFSSIPEPAQVFMLGLGLAAVSFRHRRQLNSQQQ